MCKYLVTGQKSLSGDVFISGAKNAVLPIMAASILNKGITILNNVPMLLDTFVSIDILRSLGSTVDIDFSNNSLYINTKNIYKTQVKKDLAIKMRSSIIFMGSILSRFKEASISFPGGCNLGDRPIDFHIQAFEELGITINKSQEQDLIYASFNNINNNNIIRLPFASVGATQNIILASIFENNYNKNNKVIIKNAAKEPEITDLILFLRLMGADITGENTSTIIINGVDQHVFDAKNKNSVLEYTIMPDRIEAGTFLCIGARNIYNNKNNKNKIKINNLNPLHLTSVIQILKSIGVKLEVFSDYILVEGCINIKPIELLETNPYPYFPTDLQPQFTTLLATACGDSIIKENIFTARNKHIKELNKMGTNILENSKNNVFYIKNINNNNLKATNLFAHDLRGGASLIQAALIANGTSSINNASYIMRGYEKIEDKLTLIGADIKYIK